MLSSAWHASEATLPFYLFFSDIDMDFSFNVEYFPPPIFFITYQYKSTNNLHLHLQDAADVEPFVVRKVSDHNNEQLNLREVGKLCVAKKTKGSCSVFIQVSTHDFDPKRIGFTHNSSASQAC